MTTAVKSTLFAAMLASPLFAGAASTDELEKRLAEQQKLLQQLQQQLISTQRELESIRKQGETTSKASSENSEKIELIAESAAPSSKTRTHIGGYGELHMNRLESDAGKEKNEIDFHRFVLFFGHDFNENTRFFSELEVEHAYSGTGKPGYVELEQAYIERDLNANTRVKAGLYLMPVGFLNETHEPPTFYGVERNPVEKNIIPTTWWEAGVAASGSLDNGLSWDVSLSSGLEVNADNGYSIRSGRQKVAKANFESLALTGRAIWRGMPGLTLASSIYYQDDMGLGTDPAIGSGMLFETNMNWQHKSGFGIKALYANWQLDGTGPETTGADQQVGYFVEPSWRFNEQWGIFARYNSWDNAAGNDNDTEFTQLDFGINYWLHENAVLKLDWQSQDAANPSKTYDGLNLGVGYQF